MHITFKLFYLTVKTITLYELLILNIMLISKHLKKKILLTSDSFNPLNKIVFLWHVSFFAYLVIYLKEKCPSKLFFKPLLSLE